MGQVLTNEATNSDSESTDHNPVQGNMDSNVLEGLSLPTPVPAELPKIIRFEELSRCGDEIWIENDGQIYRLRKTRAGKLILTK